MPDVVIDNPILNTPFFEPTRHFDFTDEGISDQVIDGRRSSSYFVPIPSSKKRSGKQLAFDTEWTKDRLEENKLVNDIRVRVGLWRKGGYPGVTPVTSHLLDYWTHPDREKKLFFLPDRGARNRNLHRGVREGLQRRLDRKPVA